MLVASDWVNSDLLWAVCNADLTSYGIARIWRRILPCLSVLDTREHLRLEQLTFELMCSVDRSSVPLGRAEDESVADFHASCGCRTMVNSIC